MLSSVDHPSNKGRGSVEECRSSDPLTRVVGVLRSVDHLPSNKGRGGVGSVFPSRVLRSSL